MSVTTTAAPDGSRLKSISPHSHAFPVLDGLRGLAVTLVLVIHISYEMSRQLGNQAVNNVLHQLDPLVSMGGTGVHLFFVLSGFLLFLPYANHLVAGRPWPRSAEFYRRRALRILPAYYAALLLSVVVFQRSVLSDHPVRQIVSHLLLVHNYSNSTLRGIDGPTWTLAAEAQFYVLIPVIALAGAYLLRRSRRAALTGLGLLLLLSPITAVLVNILRHLMPSLSNYDSVFATFDFMSVFGAGVACACLYVAVQQGRVAPSSVKLIARAGLPLAAVIFVGLGARGRLGIATPKLDYYFFSLAMGCCYAAMLLSLTLRDGFVRRLLSKAAPRFLGDISYSVYLLHYPILAAVIVPLAGHWNHGLWPFLVVALGLGAILLPAGIASFLIIERPFLRKKTVSAVLATSRIPTAHRSRNERELHVEVARQSSVVPSLQSSEGVAS